jgi:hypothetical protein
MNWQRDFKFDGWWVDRSDKGNELERKKKKL